MDEGERSEATYMVFDKGTICARVWAVGPKDKEERPAPKFRGSTRFERRRCALTAQKTLKIKSKTYEAKNEKRGGRYRARGDRRWEKMVWNVG